MREKFNHLYLDSHERKLLIHSLVELKNQLMLPISETSALYRIIVLMPLFYSQYISIMSVEQMHNGMLYAVWSIPVAIALVVIGSIISHKAFSKHQVR